jgi:ribosomal protein S18 acetylase RimI-like enzyme
MDTHIAETQYSQLNTSIHDRKDFDCGVAELNLYLQKHAKQNAAKNISRVFVLSETNNPSQIIGYYTLTASSVEASTFPDNVKKKLPKYPIPVALIGRLAVDKRYKGLGYGKDLLINALYNSLIASKAMAVYAVIVDAKDDKAIAFYEKFEFKSFPLNKYKMYIPLDFVSDLFSQSNT